MTRNVGIGGSFDGVRKSIVVTRGLPTAPGKRGLFEKLSVLDAWILKPFRLQKHYVLTGETMPPLLLLVSSPIVLKRSWNRHGR